jgi:antitoxin (DNA-binding transcriptional repressor) of toxin-antitoxin stability system
MLTVNIHDAKDQLSRLVEQARVEGLTLLTADKTVAQHGKPVLKG